jgi:hypothetical protein
LIQAKFSVSPEVVETILGQLQKLPLEALKLLASQLLQLLTVEQLEVWIAAHSPHAEA